MWVCGIVRTIGRYTGCVVQKLVNTNIVPLLRSFSYVHGYTIVDIEQPLILQKHYSGRCELLGIGPYGKHSLRYNGDGKFEVRQTVSLG